MSTPARRLSCAACLQGEAGARLPRADRRSRGVRAPTDPSRSGAVRVPQQDGVHDHVPRRPRAPVSGHPRGARPRRPRAPVSGHPPGSRPRRPRAPVSGHPRGSRPRGPRSNSRRSAPGRPLRRRPGHRAVPAAVGGDERSARRVPTRDPGARALRLRGGRGAPALRVLREGHRTGEAMVNIVATTPDVEALAPLAAELARRLPATASVVLNVNAKKASVAVGTEEHLLLGRGHIPASLGGLSFQVSANSFLPTNAAQAERLFAVVEGACSLSGDETVLDLYAGTGAISLLLARRCRRVYGIGVAAAAVADAVRNARTNGIANCTFLAGEVRHVLPSLMRDGGPAEGVVAHPPRARVHPKALHALAALGPG